MVDAGTLVSCEHLAFGNSVWQSAVDTLVGLSPRIVEKESRGSNSLVIKPLSSVFWGNSYNSLSWNGLFVNKSVLQVCCALKIVDHHFLTWFAFCMLIRNFEDQKIF